MITRNQLDRSFLLAICIAVVSIVVWGCSYEDHPPTAQIEVIPSAGNVLTPFELNASQSNDHEDYKQLLQYRWDTNGDGIWDMPFQKGAILIRNYPVAGTYTIILEVMDHLGQVDQTSYDLYVDSIHWFIDARDGRRYNMVQFGSTWWMTQNLAVGEAIDPAITPTYNGIIEKYIYPGEDPEHLYGGLYTWDEMMQYQRHRADYGICPEGWRIPSLDDWRQLFSNFKDLYRLKALQYDLVDMKFIEDRHVFHDNFEARAAIWRLLKDRGKTGFDLIMVGYRNPDGEFGMEDYYFPGETASFWTSTYDDKLPVRVRFYKTDDQKGEAFPLTDNAKFGFSVRCIKDTDS